jgi:ubiquinone/menaquinone biosynthesis C-methylase UbiE
MIARRFSHASRECCAARGEGEPERRYDPPMQNMQETASQYFGAMVQEYDSLIRRAVPRYDEMLDRLIDYLPPAVNRVVELGCGTGNLSLRLASRYPQAEFTFVDASAEMLRLTAERVAAADEAIAARSTLVEARFESLPIESGSADLIVSSISLHHVADKLPMYRDFRRILRRGGALRFSDQLRGVNDETHAINWERWLEFCRSAGHCSEEETQSLLDHAAAHDHYTPLAEHFDLLTRAGFTELDCVWRNWIWGIVVATAA